jgi:hypothetical protein
MSEHAMNFMPSEGFRARSKEVVENPFLRQSFRGAMDFLINKRITPSFPALKNSKPCARWANRFASTTSASCRRCWCNWKKA